MKANELMVGDWVLYNPNVFIEDEYEPTKACYPTKISSGEDLDLAVEGCYAPIHLTPEILAKNGFEVRDGTDDMELFYNDGYEVKVIFDEGCVIYEQDGETPFTEIPPSIFLVIEFAEKDISMPIEYVHELQQAMRIMGCDKEIEL